MERAIESVATEHDLRPDTSPTSTIALARWDDEHVEIYVLGDSTVAVIRQDGKEVVYSDDRLASIAGDLGRAYRERLAAGRGFDDKHRRFLARLQVEQARWRNREGGYWIAGATPEAAFRGILQTLRSRDVARIAMASDGAAAAVSNCGLVTSWQALTSLASEQILDLVEDHESQDRSGVLWPRSKRRDDKTVLVVNVRRIRSRKCRFLRGHPLSGH